VAYRLLRVVLLLPRLAQLRHGVWSHEREILPVPFGGGRRACVGASFAKLETVLVLATIARRYRLELTARGIPVPTANITLRPGRGLPMRLPRRR
jgi:cytochrome P450